MKYIVTGGRGFIGSHFVEEVLKRGDIVIDIDRMNYASHKNLPWDNHPNYTLLKQDISELQHLPTCDILINFAAESHVDNSIKDTAPFIKSNVLGVHNLLELVRGKPSYARPLFFHISTDEVYGDRATGSFNEDDKLTPSNPYSATKAAAEMLVLSYARTYQMDYIITRSANNYGPRQYEEKLISKCITSLKNDKKIPIHGDGSYVRDWLYVKDNADAIYKICFSEQEDQIWNVSAYNYLPNLDVVAKVCEWKRVGHWESHVEFIENRMGQDYRYSINSSKLRQDLDWEPTKHELFNFL